MARFEQLLACVDSIHQQSLRPREIVVVVDGCEQLAEALRKHDQQITVVTHETNRGVSAARNTGVGHVTTEWVAFLDDDATADPTWLERLVSCAETMGAVGASGWSEPAMDRPMPRWFPPELLWTVGCSYRGQPRRRTTGRNVFGGCAVLRTDLFREMGGYDVDIGRCGAGVEGCEEAEFGLRSAARDASARFAHVPDAVIHHRVGVARLTPWYVMSRCYADGRMKSAISRDTGVRGLGPERSFVTRTVPAGVIRAVATGHLACALVLLSGIGSAALGYVVEHVRPVRLAGK
jgi:GT2 family glycosyltransferase